MSARPDVLVVGGGIAGAALAWHLAPERSVLLLDQDAGPPAEATAQSSGMIRRLGEDPIERALALRTDAWLREPGEDWPAAKARAVGAVLALADDPTHLNDGVAHLRARGVAVEELADPAEVAPVLAGAPLARAWWLADELVCDPVALAEGYRQGAARRGARTAIARVVGLRRAGGRCVGVDTTEGPLEAGAVVLAAGAWCAALAAGAGLNRPLFPLRRPVFRARPAPPAGHPWAWIDDRGLWLRPDGDRWMASACEEAVDFPPPGPGSTGTPTPADEARLAAKIRALLPALDAVLADGWTGLRTFAPDRRPLLGADPELPGLWWVAGLGGYGITCAHAAAEAVAAWMAGRETPWLRRAAVDPGRPAFGRWPIRPEGAIGGSTLISGRLPELG